MTDTNYDQASRFLAREADAPMTLWLLGLTAEQVRFGTIKDSVQVFPNQERICDLIASLDDLTRGGVPCVAIIEFQITPDPEMFGRMLMAGGMIWTRMKPSPHPGDRYDLIAVVVNLTGRGNCARQVVVGTAEWKLIPREINLETLDASKVLGEIEAETAPKELLAWIPLMQNGNEDAIIERWLRIARAETDLRKRGYYGLAAVFAGAVGKKDLWKRRLEGLTMIDTPVVKEWKAGAQGDLLLRALRHRFKVVPDDLEAAIRACIDSDQIGRWMDVALDVDTLEEFRKQAKI